MHPKTVRIATVAITAFIAWLITLAALGATASLPRVAFIVVHYVLVILLFGVAFGIYYKDHKAVDPFTVTVIAMVCLFAYEFLFLVFLFEGSRWFLTYVDWLVPSFLIASTIYWTGKFFTKF
ncbi:hypothetical protein HY626_03720 [Candidatus Uhrbacteria bacterium]|nr:hypothetical protein [Candidatus Uhrbacteria bacterium]